MFYSLGACHPSIPTGYNFPSLVSPTETHFSAFLFAVHERFGLLNRSMDLKGLGIRLASRQNLFTLPRKLRFIRESIYGD